MAASRAANFTFILRQLEEKCFAKKIDLYFAFVDLVKIFDPVPPDVAWLTVTKRSIAE